MQTAKTESLDRIIKLTNELRVYHNDILKKIDQREAELKQLLSELTKPHANPTAPSIRVFSDLSRQPKGYSRITWNQSENRARTTDPTGNPPLPIHNFPVDKKRKGRGSPPSVCEDQKTKMVEGRSENSSFRFSSMDSLLMSLTNERRRFTATSYNSEYDPNRKSISFKGQSSTKNVSLGLEESPIIVLDEENGLTLKTNGEASIDSIDLSPIPMLSFNQNFSLQEEEEVGEKSFQNELLTTAAPPKRVRFTSQSPLVKMFSVDPGASEEEKVAPKGFENEKDFTNTSNTSNSADSSHSLRESIHNVMEHLVKVRKSLCIDKEGREIHPQIKSSCKEVNKCETRKVAPSSFPSPPFSFNIDSKKGGNDRGKQQGKDLPLNEPSSSLIQTPHLDCRTSISSKPIYLSPPPLLSTTIMTANTNSEDGREVVGAPDCVSPAYRSPPPIYLHRSLREKKRDGNVLKASYTINPISYTADGNKISSFSDREVASLMVENHNCSRASLLANEENALSFPSSSPPLHLRRYDNAPYVSHFGKKKGGVGQNKFTSITESTEAGGSKLGVTKAAGEAFSTYSHQPCCTSLRNTTCRDGLPTPDMLAGGPTLYFT
ncbi:unnamed protein product [Phytomonas sp. Hart1]|nr:unnamed protein product [Phytomonas sp. Hart1]|eukprot:CCW70612.1 unnamed protein product [Phytomonas sp. isolate Hart1]